MAGRFYIHGLDEDEPKARRRRARAYGMETLYQNRDCVIWSVPSMDSV